MERKILLPEQIIVPGEYEVSNELILKIYFRVFDRGHGRDLPPVIVVHKEMYDIFLDVTELDPRNINYRNDKSFYENYNRIVRNAYAAGAEYFLLNGNHRSIAATLTQQSISALEIRVDEDIRTGNQMVETGELFDEPIVDETLNDSRLKLKGHLKEYLLSNVEGIRSIGKVIDTFPLTVKERVDLLVSNDNLPEYMKKRYHERR